MGVIIALPDLTPLNVSLLGAFRLSAGDTTITAVNTPRLQALLTFLLLRRGEPQSRQQLAFLFWPDTTDAQARTNLRNLLHRLRDALPDADAHLDSDARNMWWRADAPVTLDVADFERAIKAANAAEQRGDDVTAQLALERAADIYRGELLPDCYDDWITPERDRLREAMVSVLERLIGALERRRSYEAAIPYARRLLTLDALHEGAHLTLIRLLAANGDRAGALRAYHACVTTFRQELGIEPGKSIQDAYSRIVVAETHETDPITQIAQAPLIGRNGEWQRILITWQTVRAGSPRLLTIKAKQASARPVWWKNYWFGRGDKAQMRPSLAAMPAPTIWLTHPSSPGCEMNRCANIAGDWMNDG